MPVTPLKPLVSVILPTRNRAQILPRAIKSVLSQTYHHFELLVVDDGSDDNTPDVVQGFADPRIRYIRHEIFLGPGAARNEGNAAARGEFIAFLDDDDEFSPNKLSIQVEAFQQAISSVSIVVSDVQVYRDGSPVEFYPYDGEAGSIFHHVLSGNWFPLNASLFSRHGLPAFDDRLPCLEDVDFHLKVLQKSKAAYVRSIVGLYNIDDKRKRLSQDRVNMHRSFRILQERYFNDPKDNLLADAKPELLANFALRLIALGYTDEMTREYLNRAFKLKKIGKMLWYRLLNLGGPGLLKKLK